MGESVVCVSGGRLENEGEGGGSETIANGSDRMCLHLSWFVVGVRR